MYLSPSIRSLSYFVCILYVVCFIQKIYIYSMQFAVGLALRFFLILGNFEACYSYKTVLTKKVYDIFKRESF